MRDIDVDLSCLYTTIRNRGAEKVFGFLPPHGRRLAAGEEFTVFGNLDTAIIRGDRLESRRCIMALEDAINRGDIEIIHTPAPILQDRTTGSSKQLTVTGGTLGTRDPCWRFEGSYSGAV